jgi:hypothetical protein
MDASLKEQIMGNSGFQRKRVLKMHAKIDEEILIDDIKTRKALHKNVIKQFKHCYPGDLTAIKDLQ